MKILVIGAGVAGLAVARELTKAGLTLVVVEARARLGGRILTRHARRHGFAVDLGPEFIHGHPPETAAWARPGEIIALPDRERVFFRDKILDSPANDVMKVFESMRESRPDRAVATALAELNLSALERALATSFAEGFNASDATRMSVNALVGENQRSTDDLLQNQRFLPGYHALVERMALDITEAGGVIRLNERVHDVSWRPGEARVRIAREAGEVEETYDAVVTTVPVSCLADLVFAPELPKHAAAARQIAMGDVHKVTFTFKEKLWAIPADVKLDFLHSPELTFGTRWAWGWTDAFTLTCWSAGRRAEALKHVGDQAVVDLALAEAARALGRPEAELRGLVDEIFYHDWVNDPLSRGAYSWVTVDGVAARATLGQSVSRTLYFAGEALENDGAAGTVHGALRTGLRAAVELLNDHPSAK